MARRSTSRARWALVASILLLVGDAGVAGVRSEDIMWGGLIFAENPSKDGPTKISSRWPAALAGREKQISRIFGYKQLRVIGQAQQKIKTGEEDWLVPSKRFYLKVDTKYPIPNGYLLNLQLYQEDKMLVEANVQLARGNPLYIRGPQVGNGQLIIALQCGGKEAAWTKPKSAATHPAAASAPAAAPSPAAAPVSVPAAAPAAPAPDPAKPTASATPASKA
jgi:hypothetical protein